MKYIVIGLTPQGLSLLRSLARAGLDVYGLCNTCKNVGYSSKYGKKSIFNNIEDLKAKINLIAKGCDEKPICYITSGEMLAWILREFPEIYEICQVSSGPKETIDILAHKDNMYEYAIRHGMKVANYVTLDKYESGKIKFPAFLKRNYEIPLFFKAEKIDNEEHLKSFISRIKETEKKDVILQEFISIPTNVELNISCQALFKNGVCEGTLITNQLRRLKKGLTSYIEEIQDENLKNKIDGLCKNFFKNNLRRERNSDGSLDYSGLIEFEFIYDKRNGDIWFIEVNTRACGLQSSFAHKYLNLSESLAYPSENLKLIAANDNLKWMNIQRDIRARIQNRNFRNLTDIFKCKFDVWDLKDIKPFFAQFRL